MISSYYINAPQSSAEIRLAWKAVLGSSRVSYLAGPITTGRRFFEWYNTVGFALQQDSDEYKRELRAVVIEPNELNLLKTAELLRSRTEDIVVEPASLLVGRWRQHDYVELWKGFIADHARRVFFMVDWEYSAGCVAEFCQANLKGIPTFSVDGVPIVEIDGVAAISKALLLVERLENPPFAILETLREAYAKVNKRVALVATGSIGNPRKDQSLDRLAETINVAQFVSFEPSRRVPTQTYSRVLGESPNKLFSGARDAAEVLLFRSSDNAVNVRSFNPDSPQSQEFIYGLKSVDQIVAAVERLTSEGLNTIINETIDIHDGGVSGVLLGNVIEFAPDDTPRAVEKSGIASLPSGWGLNLLTSVYGFDLNLAVPANCRLEFSIHPKPRGWKRTHTIGWEISEVESLELPATLQWPNRFSRLIGDKVFGLLIAHHIGLPVPKTSVINRRIAPFTFGQATGDSEIWLRTAPFEQVPGRFTTKKGWSDPFKILADEDPTHSQISSVIAQMAVPAEHSGASIVLANGEVFTEGVRGSGDNFMVGAAKPEELPKFVLRDVENLHFMAAALGAVRLEWVHDGQRAWVVQLHRGATNSERDILVKGEAAHWIEFNVSRGLPALRELLLTIEPGTGLSLSGEVGLTSHIADVIRKARIPARMKANLFHPIPSAAFK